MKLLNIFLVGLSSLVPFTALATPFPPNNPSLVEYTDSGADGISISVNVKDSTPNNITDFIEQSAVTSSEAWGIASFDLSNITGDYRNFSTDLTLSISGASPSEITLNICSQAGSVGMTLSQSQFSIQGKNYCVGVNPALFSPNYTVAYYLYISPAGSFPCGLSSIPCSN